MSDINLVLLVNLGTPDSCSKPSIKKFLRKFLMDRRVISLPYFLRFILVNFLIIPFRLSKVQKVYQAVWTGPENNSDGSPLLIHMKNLERNLQDALGNNYLVKSCMTYSEPSIFNILDIKSPIKKIIILPLYPQFSATTTAPVFDQIAQYFKNKNKIPDLVFIHSYFNHALYIQALTQSVLAYQKIHGTPELLIFSFHGLPEINIQRGDPYYFQCQETARLLAGSLNLKSSDYLVTFQSRVGAQAWLKPYTDQVLQELPREKNIKNIKNIQIICPGFSMDCIETLEEIALQNKELFLQSGGEKFGFIPCLNSTPGQVGLLEGLIRPQFSSNARAAGLHAKDPS